MKGSFCVREGLPRDRNRWWSGVCCSCSLCRRRYLFDAAGWGNWVRAGAGFTYLVRTLKTLWSSARSAPKFLVGAAILDRPDDATFALHPFTLHRPPRSPAFFFAGHLGGQIVHRDSFVASPHRRACGLSGCSGLYTAAGARS